METTRRAATRITRTLVAPHAGADTVLFLIFLSATIIGSAMPWALAAAIPFGLAWAIRGIMEDRARRSAQKPAHIYPGYPY